MNTKPLKKMKIKTFITFLLCTSLIPFAQAQDMSTITCQIHEMVMGKQILPFRQQGIMPVGEAERMFNDENDVRTRVFLKNTVRNLYANPAGAEKYLNSGQFMRDCVKVNRGY
jgi:hypothetical protein